MGGIVALAWFSFWWLDRSGLGWLIHAHGAAQSHHSHAAGWIELPAFLSGWLLMTVAMMLPTTYPLVRLFRRMVADRPGRASLVSLLLVGYVAAWLGFGGCVLVLIRGFDLLAARWSPVAGRTDLWAAGLFLLAGAFQFSSLKYACLDKCRSPFGFLASHWRGRDPLREAFALGWRHGVFCVGCCWALMLLMFAVVSAGLAWMLVLALIMAVEKNVTWGRAVGRPLGGLLLVVGIVIVVRHLPA